MANLARTTEQKAAGMSVSDARSANIKSGAYKTGNTSKAPIQAPTTAGTTPTVISDNNIRENVIPDIKQKAEKLLSDFNDYKAQQEQQGGQTQQDRADESAGTSEYDQLYKDAFGTTQQQDPFYDSEMNLLEQMRGTSDRRTANQLAGITSQFQQRKGDLAQVQASQSATTNAALLRSGASRYAPTNAAGIMSAVQRGFVRSLSAIDLQEQQAKNEALQAQEDNDYKLLGQKLEVLSEKRKEKLDVVNKMYDSIVEEKKQTQKELSSLAETMRNNGAPGELINQTMAAPDLATAAEIAGVYGAGGAGVIGEYNRYVADATTNGQVPLSFSAYQDMDANRKRSIVNNYAGGLSNTQLTKATTIADQFKNEQTIKDYQTIAQGVAAFDSLGNSPADDIQRIYTFAKTMDPNSAVREGEYSTVQQYAQAYLPTLGIRAQRLVDNRGFLTEEARSMMQASLEKKFAPVKNNYESIRNSYADRINKITGNDDGKEFLTEYTIPPNPVAEENKAQNAVIQYGAAHPEAQEQIKQMAGIIQPELNRAYTWAEIRQILGI